MERRDEEDLDWIGLEYLTLKEKKNSPLLLLSSSST